MGYNIIRVPLRNEEALKSISCSKRTIPLSAPLVISDNRGSKIYHPPILLSESETSLFEGKSGEAILAGVPITLKMLLFIKMDHFFILK